MKALLRNSAGLLALLLIGSVSNGYYWVTPVLKQPYPVGTSPSNSGFYLMDAMADGRVRTIIWCRRANLLMEFCQVRLGRR